MDNDISFTREGLFRRLRFVFIDWLGLAVFAFLYDNGIRSVNDLINKLSSQNIQAALSGGVVSKISLSLSDGRQITADILEGNISDSSPTGLLTLQTDSGEILTANIDLSLINLGNQDFEIEDYSITAIKLAPDSVTDEKIEENTISGIKIIDGTITGGKLTEGIIVTQYLGDNAVTSIKIKDGAITTEKLLDKVVITEKLADVSVTEIKLADGSVVTGKISNLAVTADKIANATITDIQLADGAVITAKVADGAITEIKLADGSISLSKLSGVMCSTGEILKKNGSNWECSSDIGSTGFVATVTDGDGITNTGTVTNPILNANTDNVTIEITADAIQLKDGGVTSAKILDGTIVNDDISALAGIEWGKIDKAGSNLTDIATRNFSDLLNRLAQYVDVTDTGNYFTATDTEGTLQEIGGNYFKNNGNSFGTSALIGTNDNNSFGIETNGTTKLTVLADGKVGIGTTSPGNKLVLADGILHFTRSVNDTSITRIRFSGSNISGNADIYADQGFIAVNRQIMVTGEVVAFSFNSGNARGTASSPLIGGFSNLGAANKGGIFFPDSGSSTPTNIAFSTDAVERLRITTSGNVGIGTTSPLGKLHSYVSNSAVTAASYNGYFENLATNTTTDGINKYGLYVTSTGSFTGAGGTATNNYGLYVDTPTGADNNYAAVFTGGNVGIGTTSPSGILHVAGGNPMITNVGAINFLLDNSSTGNTTITLDRQTSVSEAKIIFQDNGTTQWGFGTKTNTNNFVIRDADSTERFTILKNTGLVGINTTPTNQFEVSGNTVSRTASYILNGVTNGAQVMGAETSSFKAAGLIGMSGGSGLTIKADPLGYGYGTVGTVGAALGNSAGGRSYIGLYGYGLLSSTSLNNSDNRVAGGTFIAEMNGGGSGSSTATIYGLYAKGNSTGTTATSGSTTGIYGEAIGVANQASIGGYFTASGGTTNYGVYSAAGYNYLNGNLRIGETGTPTSKVDIVGASGIDANIKLTRTSGSSGYLSARNTSEGLELVTATASPLVFKTNSVEAMRILSGGNVGIGTTNPTSLFSVGASSQFQVNSTGAVAAATGITSSGTITFSSLTGCASGLQTDGSGVLSCLPSDISVKNSIEDITTPLEKVLGMRGVSYKWNDTELYGEATEFGLIAQEVEVVAPELVFTMGTGIKGVKYNQLGALLLEGIKEQQSEINVLKNKLEELKNAFEQHGVTITYPTKEDNYFVKEEDLIVTQNGIKTLENIIAGGIISSSEEDFTLEVLAGKGFKIISMGQSLLEINAHGKLTLKESEAGSVGSSIITAGEISVFVPNTSVTENSKIFVTPNQFIVFKVVNQAPQSGFTIEISEPAAENVKFSWFVVN